MLSNIYIYIYLCAGLERLLVFQEVGSQVSKQSVHEGGLSDLRIGRLCSREDIAVLISLRGRVGPWTIAGPERMKNSNDITRYLPSCNTVPFVHINNEYNITKEPCVCVCVCVCNVSKNLIHHFCD
jgi:hypothetical protein